MPTEITPIEQPASSPTSAGAPRKWKGGERPLIVDLYHGDKVSDWDKLASAVDAVTLKATDGVTFTDPTFKIRLAECQKRKIPVAAYHFLHPSDSPQDQAQHFKSVVPEWISGICDMEITEGQIAIRVKTVAEIWMKSVSSKILYSSVGFLGALGDLAFFDGFKFWIAEYGPTCKWDSPLMWQYTESGTIPGVDGHCDLSWFYGSDAEFDEVFKIGVGFVP